MLPYTGEDHNHKLHMVKTLSRFEEAIRRIKGELLDLGPMRPGSLSRQYRDPKTKKRPFHQIS